MLIDCPHCGMRDHSEFAYHGDATKVRPDTAELNNPDGVEVSDKLRDDFYSYVYERDNPKGVHEEHWYHVAGCRSWLRVSRDTFTHEIISVTSE